MLRILTVSLVVVLALSVDIAITALAILIIALLAVLRVVSLLLLLLAAVVALLVLGHAITATVGLAGLEGSCTGGEAGSAGAELRATLIVAQVHLLGLLGQVLVLGGRIVFPRVEVRHDEVGRWLSIGLSC